MMKEHANIPASPATIIELTDEELESMRGGCHDDDGCDDGCGDRSSRRGFDDGRRFGFEERFSFRESDRFSFRDR